jgi:hypothetical protein
MNRRRWIIAIFAVVQFSILFASWGKAYGSAVEFLASFTGIEVPLLSVILYIAIYNKYLQRQTSTQKITSTVIFVLMVAFIASWSILIYPQGTNSLLKVAGKSSYAKIESYTLRYKNTGGSAGYIFTNNTNDPTQATFITAKISYDGHTSNIFAWGSSKEFTDIYEAASGSKPIQVKYLGIAPAFVLHKSQ